MYTFLLFVILFLLIGNHLQLTSLFSVFKGKKRKVTMIQDTWITELLRKKTGLVLHQIAIFETDQLFGMMPSLPYKPYMILSRGIYKKLSREELEWVVLHEAAHCIFLHVTKLALIQMIFLSVGIYILSGQSILIGALLGILFAILYIQCAKYTEYEADQFSISHVDNPEAVITAQNKLRKHYKISENSLIRKVFYNQMPLSRRIAMAQARLDKRTDPSP